MSLAVVGINHRTAPVRVRERLAYSRAEIPAALRRLLGSGALDEAVLLSTCNRTEVYLSAADETLGEAAARELLAEQWREPQPILSYLYARRGRSVVEHLFRVTSGIDSMILGEPQIQGQVREAYQLAMEVGKGPEAVVGPILNRLFQTALSVGGRVRTETEVGMGAASISSAAVELAKKIFGTLKGRHALVLGAGEMSAVTLECLRAEGVQSCVVANRTYDRAVELAERFRGRAVHWEALGEELPHADIVICSTAAPHPVLTLKRLRASLPGGAKRPLCIIDIAIPRDVEVEVGEEPNVFLYNVDDLQQIVDDSLGRRRREIPAAEAIISAASQEFWSWYTSLSVVPTIRELRERGESLRRAEVDRALRRLAHLSEPDRDAVEALTRSLMNKLLHAPTVRLRKAAGNGRGLDVIDTARYLFELDKNDEDLDDTSADQGSELDPESAGGRSGGESLQPDEGEK
ncbi:MAG TPA: glutamyl-tRNA reductase [Longimicrobiaceae bacterium]